MQIRKTTKLEKVLALMVMLSLLLGSIVGYTIAQSTTTFYITRGIYPSAYTHTIYKEGSIYSAKNEYGFIDYQSSNASYVINSALTHSGVTYLKTGLYYLSRGIKITVEASVLKGEVRGSDFAELVLMDNVNEDVISSDSIKYNFRCEDIIINGNNQHNTIGDGIDCTYLEGDIIRVHVRNCAGDGFRSEQEGTYFNRCVASDNNGSGFYIFNVYGAGYFQCYTRNNDNHGFYISSNGSRGTGDLNFVNCETDGGDDEEDGFHITGTNTRRINLVNCQLLNMHGIGLYVGDNAGEIYVSNGNFYACDYGVMFNHAGYSTITANVEMNLFDGIVLTNASSFVTLLGCNVNSNSQNEIGVYDGIRIDSSSSNIVESCKVRGYENIHNYGIFVTGSSPDRNLILGCFAFDSVDGKNIVVTGANTYVLHSFNSTTYIESYP